MATVTNQGRVTTTTQDFFLPNLVDIVLNSNVFFTRIVAKAKKWRGEQLKFPMKHVKNTNGSSFQGDDLLSTSSTDNRDRFAYDPAFYSIPAKVNDDEQSVNATADGFLNLVELAVQGAAEDMADDLGTIFYQDGTGNSSKDPLGLEAIVDDGTNTATLGGLTRSSFAGSVLDSTVTASGGTLTIAKMDTLYSAITSGSQKPTAGYSDQTVWDLYGQLIRSEERIPKDVPMMKAGIVAGTGFTGLFYRGFPLLADEKATSGVLYFLNEDWIDWHGLQVARKQPIKFTDQISGNDYSASMNLGFSWSGWIQPINQASMISHIYFAGNLVTRNPKRHGKLTGITGI